MGLKFAQPEVEFEHLSPIAQCTEVNLHNGKRQFAANARKEYKFYSLQKNILKTS